MAVVLRLEVEELNNISAMKVLLGAIQTLRCRRGGDGSRQREP